MENSDAMKGIGSETVKRKGPYTIRRDELTEQYRWKAENIVRFFDKLGMSKKEKVKYLAQEFAGVHMNVEITQAGFRLLQRREVR